MGFSISGNLHFIDCLFNVDYSLLDEVILCLRAIYHKQAMDLNLHRLTP